MPPGLWWPDNSLTVSGEAEVFSHGVLNGGAQQMSVATNAKRRVQKVVSEVGSVTLLLLGLASGASALAVVGATPALADATLPMTQMLPSYAKGTLDAQPGSKTYPGLVVSPTTYTVYTDPNSDYVTLQQWPADLASVFSDLPGKNSMEVSGFSHLVLLPGDSLVGHGAVAQGMNGSGTTVALPDGTKISDLFSPAAGFFAPTPDSKVISSFKYTPGDGQCATDAPFATASGTVQNLWCLDIGYFEFAINKIKPPDTGTQWSIGFEPDWAKMLTTYPGIADSTASGLRYLGGPNQPLLGANATNEGYVFVPNPRLQLIKEVCSTGTGCIANTAGSAADTPVPDDQVNGGLWVDAATLPLGSTQAEWRITVKNTGNIQLQNVHLANDKTATDPKTDDASKVGTDDCMTQGASMGDLMPGASDTIYCTTALTGNLQSNLVNWANANGSIPDYVNYLTGAATTASGNNAVELAVPETADMDMTVAQAYKGNAQADNTDVTGMVPSNNDAAMVNFVKPGLKLTKWVCKATTCATPTGADLAALAGYSNSGGVTAGVAKGDWVKATQVSDGSTAQWLMVATNIGNTPLGGVTLKSDITTDAGTEIANPITFTKVYGDDPLLPGASAIFTASTPNITNTNHSGQQTTHRMDAITTLDDAQNVLFVTDTGEFTYQPGNDVVNTAVATGQPLNDNGQPLTDASGQTIKGADGEDLMVVSNESTAEVTTLVVPPPAPPSPGIKLTKWVCGHYTGDNPDCALPTGDDLATLAGLGSTGEVTEGHPAGGWVKFVQVPSGDTVDWLMIATNIGNTDLSGVTLQADSLQINNVTVNKNNPFSKVSGVDPLPPGGSAIFTAVTDDVTNGGKPGGTTGSTTITVTVPGTSVSYDTGELAYNPGNDMANLATASGTPLDEDGNPIKADGVIQSNPAVAEASTDKPQNKPSDTPSNTPGGQKANTGGSLVDDFAGDATLVMLLGVALLAWSRRRPR